MPLAQSSSFRNTSVMLPLKVNIRLKVCAWSSVLSTGTRVLAEGIKFQYVTKFSPKIFSAWHYLICGVCAPPSTAVWKWENSSCNCSRLRAPHVGWCGSCSASALALTKERGCGRMLHMGHHTFSCLQSSLVALVPWDSAAQSAWHRAGMLKTHYTVRESRRQATSFTGDLSYPHSQLEM